MTKLSAVLLTFGILCACSQRHFDRWEICYDIAATDFAVTHLIVKSDSEVLDEQYFKNADGSLVKFYREGFSSEMPPPDWLYVQWIESSSGISHEREVSLKGRMPANLEGQKLTVVFDRADVYVFLVHFDTPAEGVHLLESSSPQLFPDPTLKPYVGAHRPKNWALPSK